MEYNEFTRPLVEPYNIETGIKHLVDKLYVRLSQKGAGSYSSRHEILGILEEEMLEIKEAIRIDTPEGYEHYKRELLDIGVAGLFGYICMGAYIKP